MLLPSIVPFTVAFLKPINDKLFEKVDTLTLGDVKAENDEGTKQLIDSWTKLHLVRTAITGAGALLALWAALDKREAIVGGLRLGSGANRLG